MDQPLAERSDVRARLLIGVWAASPLIVVAYVLLRYGMEGRDALLASQVVFLTPLCVAAAAFITASRSARPGSRSRIVWALLAGSVSFLFISEAILSYAEVQATRPHEFLFDVANTVAILLLFTASVITGAFDRLGWRRAVRVLLDGLLMLVLAFGIVYRLFGEEHAARVGDVWAALRMTAYALIGPALVEAGVLTFRNAHTLRAPWNRVLAAGMMAMAVATSTWSLSQFGANGGGSAGHAFSSVMYLVAYCLFMLAGMSRVLRARPVMRSAPRRTLSPAWIGLAFSTIVLGAVLELVLFAGAGGPDSARAVYTAVLAMAAILVVARTLFATSESRELTERTTLDPITGVLGPPALPLAWDATAYEAVRRGRSVVIYSVDMDDFARVNAGRGSFAADGVLTAVARALERAAGSNGWLIRIGDDEFVVVTSVIGGGEAEALGLALCAAVRLGEGLRPVTASVGSALQGEDGHDLDTLLTAATSAQMWAKRQGKNRYAPYDAAIGQALTIDARLAVGTQASRDVARALVAASDARDPESHDHSRNVAVLSRMLACDLGLPDDHVGLIELAAVLHDIGKIALPNVMLGGKTLSVRERDVAREHSELGENLLEFLGGAGVPQWVRSHHERWDGQGYPDGLRGEEIPLESRIIALADAYDSMIAGRRYGAPMSKAAALQELDLGIGVRFDPELTERFITVVGSSGAMGWSDQWTATP